MRNRRNSNWRNNRGIIRQIWKEGHEDEEEAGKVEYVALEQEECEENIEIVVVEEAEVYKKLVEEDDQNEVPHLGTYLEEQKH